MSALLVLIMEIENIWLVWWKCVSNGNASDERVVVVENKKEN
jgi:hypothetical protein